MNEKEIYIVTAYRWGDRSDHSYNLGVFQEKHRAKEVAESHRNYRGGKYACVVDKCVLNQFHNEVDNYIEEIYRAKSVRD